MQRSPKISIREAIAASLLAIVVAAGMNLRLLADIDSVTPAASADEYLQVWQVAWGGHALITQPLAYYDSNAFWPNDASLTFSDALTGYAPLGILANDTRSAVIIYNLLFLLASSLPFIGAYLLARELGGHPASALVAGAAFAYAPFRLLHLGHLHVLSSGGIPLALFLLLRGYRRRSNPMVAAGWIVSAWQLSIGFAVGLQFVYLLATLVLGAFVLWLQRGHEWQALVVRGSAIGLGIFIAWALIQGSAYWGTLQAYPEAARSIDEVRYYSPPPRALLAAPAQNPFWGPRTAKTRDSLPFSSEACLFPGVIVSMLALLGLTVGKISWRLKILLLLLVSGSVVLSFGFAFENGVFGYRWLYQFGPGWKGLRTPGRLATLTSLGLGLLASAAIERTRSSLARKGAWLPYALSLVLAAGVILEGANSAKPGGFTHPPGGTASAMVPQYHLPSAHFIDALYMMWSIDDNFPSMANGYSGFLPSSLRHLRDQTVGFPDPKSIRVLQGYGVRSVIVHRSLAKGTPWEGAIDKAFEDLGITRTINGDAAVYEIPVGPLRPSASGEESASQD